MATPAAIAAARLGRASRVAELVEETSRAGGVTRRDFLRTLGGAIGSAVTASPSRVVGTLTESATGAPVRFLEDASGLTGLIARSEPYPGADPIVAANFPASWWGRPSSLEGKQAADSLRREVFDAGRRLPSAQWASVPSPAGGQDQLPMIWNRATGQWHAAIWDKDASMVRYLQPGSAVPASASWPHGLESPAKDIDQAFYAFGRTPGELANTLHREYGLALGKELADSRVIDQKAMRENPQYREAAVRYAESRGLTPGATRNSTWVDTTEPASGRAARVPVDPTAWPGDAMTGPPMSPALLRATRALAIPAVGVGAASQQPGLLDGLREQR